MVVAKTVKFHRPCLHNKTSFSHLTSPTCLHVPPSFLWVSPEHKWQKVACECGLHCAPWPLYTDGICFQKYSFLWDFAWRNWAWGQISTPALVGSNFQWCPPSAEEHTQESFTCFLHLQDASLLHFSFWPLLFSFLRVISCRGGLLSLLLQAFLTVPFVNS